MQWLPSFRKMIPTLKELLTEGCITPETLLDNVSKVREILLNRILRVYCKVLAVIRESNVTLRWLMLHTTQLSAGVAQHKRTRQLLDLARQEAKVASEDVLSLIVQVSRLEQHTKQLYTRSLCKWLSCVCVYQLLLQDDE